jgi:hypothetical protein
MVSGLMKTNNFKYWDARNWLLTITIPRKHYVSANPVKSHETWSYWLLLDYFLQSLSSIPHLPPLTSINFVVIHKINRIIHWLVFGVIAWRCSFEDLHRWWAKHTVEINTKTGFTPFICCQLHLHPELLLFTLINPQQLISISWHHNHVSFTVREICLNIIVFLVWVRIWSTTTPEKETSMTNLIRLN